MCYLMDYLLIEVIVVCGWSMLCIGVEFDNYYFSVVVYVLL